MDFYSFSLKFQIGAGLRYSPHSPTEISDFQETNVNCREIMRVDYTR